jgi:hypothetical protein
MFYSYCENIFLFGQLIATAITELLNIEYLFKSVPKREIFELASHHYLQINSAISTNRFEYPHSLSYQPTTLT